MSRAASGAVVTGAAPGYACVLCGLLVVCVVIRLGTRKTYIPSRARHVGDRQRYDLSIYLSVCGNPYCSRDHLPPGPAQNSSTQAFSRVPAPHLHLTEHRKPKLSGARISSSHRTHISPGQAFALPTRATPAPARRLPATLAMPHILSSHVASHVVPIFAPKSVPPRSCQTAPHGSTLSTRARTHTAPPYQRLTNLCVCGRPSTPLDMSNCK